MRNFFILPFLVFLQLNLQAKMNANKRDTDVNIIQVSQQLLLAAKTKQPADAGVNTLKNITASVLEQQLFDDAHKKAFWINIYNAYTQIILTKNSDNYKNRNAFFTKKQIIIANQSLSLDDIEHGILRHSKIKWSLGYLNKLFPSSFEKKHRADTLDYRIHFTLNCGAKSCPPIAFYKPEQINQQLDIATNAYLNSEVNYKEKENVAYLPAIMGWFRRDFGGKKAMLKLLHDIGVIPVDKFPSIKFSKYNWNLFLENYKTE